MYIRLQELEFLLSHYKELQALLQEFEIEAAAVLNEERDDAIYACTMKRTLDGMPTVSHRISDRTSSTALNIHRLSREQRAVLEEINEDILFVSMILEKIDIALHAVRPYHRQIIKKKYFKGQTWRQISEALNYDERTLKRYKNEALERMMKIVQIDILDYVKIRRVLIQEGE